jgi:hypothetical protein
VSLSAPSWEILVPDDDHSNKREARSFCGSGEGGKCHYEYVWVARVSTDMYADAKVPQGDAVWLEQLQSLWHNVGQRCD